MAAMNATINNQLLKNISGLQSAAEVRLVLSLKSRVLSRKS